jgi:histidinol dehydrogenase
MMRRLSTHSESFDQELNDLLSFSEDDQTAIEKTVISILKEVRIEGDDAVIRHTNQFDRL